MVEQGQEKVHEGVEAAIELGVDFTRRCLNVVPQMLLATFDLMKAWRLMLDGLGNSVQATMEPCSEAAVPFCVSQLEKLPEMTPTDMVEEATGLAEMNMKLGSEALQGGMLAATNHAIQMCGRATSAWTDTFFGSNGSNIATWAARELEGMDAYVRGLPLTVEQLEKEFGFHPGLGNVETVMETSRFYLYQVKPRDVMVQVKKRGKPVLIRHPYVLGEHLFNFLPEEGRSYVQAFADDGTPTYIMVAKDAYLAEGVQKMSKEDDIRDMKLFAKFIKKKHRRQVTLIGICQGAYFALMGILSGKMKGLANRFITCVGPIDGSEAQGFKELVEMVPKGFRSLNYARKFLPNGNVVINGKIVSFTYKLRRWLTQNPIADFFTNLAGYYSQKGKIRVSKMAAAITRWLTCCRKDLPCATTQVSLEQFTIPIAEDGTLPVKLFGKKLNIHDIYDMGIEDWLICVAKDDDLLELEAAIAPLKYVWAKLTVFPKGHAAMFTSWSVQNSECALHLEHIPLPPGYKHPQEGSENHGPVWMHRFWDQQECAKEADAQQLDIPAAYIIAQQTGEDGQAAKLEEAVYKH